MGLITAAKLLLKGKKSMGVIKSVAPNVPKTKLEKTVRDVKILTHKRKAQLSKLYEKAKEFKKQLQEVMDRGSYSLKDAPTREFLKEQRKKTVKKILKINKPK